MEKFKELRRYEVRQMCNQCDWWEMEHTGIVLTSNPAQYPHKCNKCWEMETFYDNSYPKKTYKYLDEV